MYTVKQMHILQWFSFVFWRVLCMCECVQVCVMSRKENDLKIDATVKALFTSKMRASASVLNVFFLISPKSVYS